MDDVQTEKDYSRMRSTWRERAFVFVGIAVAGGASAGGAGEEILAPAWLAAIGWTVLASLALALWRGFRHGDWSSFRGGAHGGGRFQFATSDLIWDDGGRCESAASPWLGGDTDREIFDPTYSFLQANIYHYRHDD